MSFGAIFLQPWFPPFAFCIAALAAWSLCFPILHQLRKRELLDRPNERSSHTTPTPRGGGIAIVLVALVGLAILALQYSSPVFVTLCGCIVALGGISFLDDIRELPARLRFGVQCVAAIAMLWALAVRTANGPEILGVHPAGLVAGLFLALWLIGYTNAFNFMDGINGISAGQALVTGLGTALIGREVLGSWTDPLVTASIITAGAALGFLPHNFPKARMFMGDVGSAPLGFILAALAVAVALEGGVWLIIPLFLLHANYILDTAITLVRRILRGEKFYQAHREHFYQRLVRSGKSHTFATGCEGLLQLGTLVLALAYLNSSFALRMLIVCGVVLLWLVFFAWVEVRFRASQPELKSASGLAPGAAK